jgi:hypothetical protein
MLDAKSADLVTVALRAATSLTCSTVSGPPSKITDTNRQGNGDLVLCLAEH